MRNTGRLLAITLNGRRRLRGTRSMVSSIISLFKNAFFSESISSLLLEEIGAPIDQEPVKHDGNELDYERHIKKYLWSRIRHSIRDPLAEFLGCFILIIFGDGSVAQVVLSSNPDLPKGSQNKGAYQSISWG
jgi:hypothetical protein